MATSVDDYSSVFATLGIQDAKAAAISLSAKLEVDGEVNLAFMVRSNLVRLLEDLKAAAVTTAATAQVAIRHAEATSRVRPDTHGTGGLRLGDYLGDSRPLPENEGSVGINDEEPLRDFVPWWWTNEEGYSGHVGREIKGYFFEAGWTGASAPNPSEFRQHPLFSPGAKGMGPRGGAGRRMTIKNPIPERRFVQQGTRDAEVEWHRLIRAAKHRYDAELDRVRLLILRRYSTPGPGRGRRRS